MAALPPQVRGSLETKCEALAHKVWTKYNTTQPADRVLIGVAGIPGVGKSTITDLVASSLNKLHAAQAMIVRGNSENAANRDEEQHQEQTTNFAMAVPMDGFHYSRSHLLSMPDPQTAVHRRGAPFTYDADAYLAFIQSLVHSQITNPKTLYAPSFSHTLKDPVQDDIPIPPESRIILIEGNYCALNRDPWLRAANLMNELWFIDADLDMVRHRLAKRHVESGICVDLEAAYDRIQTTDFLNATEIVENLLEVDEVIKV